MSYKVRHQLFISSTFLDLKEERAEVLRAALELDCIPTGMEAFLASNDSQWDIISKVIEECDYYILIIGGRYGSTASDGLSYTEKEFDLAKRLGIPILAFVHESPENISIGKSDVDPIAREKLKAFRDRVTGDRMVKQWKTPQDLGAVVSRSLVQEMKRNPRPGWIRNDGSSPVDLLERISSLTAENDELRKKNHNVESPRIPLDELGSGTDEYILEGSVIASPRGLPFSAGVRKSWRAKTNWDRIIINIGPPMAIESSETEIRDILRRFISLDDTFKIMDHSLFENTIQPKCLDDVIVQFRALGMIERGTKRRAVTDRERYWKLTEKGDFYVVNLLARRKKVQDPEVIPEPISEM